MFTKIISFAILTVAVCRAQSEHGHAVGGQSYTSWGSHHGHQEVVQVPDDDYQYKYGVSDAHTKDNHAQQESRHHGHVRGEYSLHEPDGTIRIVKYAADKENGFNAQVIKKGHAVHPAVQQHSRFAVFAHHGGLGDESGGSGLVGHGGY